jgi:hypothetical protein
MKYEIRTGPTPAGGVRSEIIYLDENDELVDKEVAKRVEIIEYDRDDKVIRRTYGEVG